MATQPNDLEAEVFDVLSLSDSSATQDNTNPQSGSASQPQSEAGEGLAAPSSSPEPAPAASEEPPQPAAPEPAPAKAPEGTEPSPQPAPSEPPAASEPPVPDERTLREASLSAQVDALRRELEQLRANPQGQGQQPQTPAAENGQQPAGEQPVRYGLSLPKPVQDALTSDDPGQMIQAISQIVNDLGTIVHNSVVTQLRTEMRELVNGLKTGGVDSEEARKAAAAEEARKAYYTAFPNHDNELILPIVQTEAAKMQKEFPGLPWNADYINALGARVNKALETLRGGGSQQQQLEPAPQPAPAPKPAVMLPSGQRAGAPVPTSEAGQGELIEDTFAAFGE